MKKIFTILGISAGLFMDAQIVINEAYGGGGNSGATLTNDFIELINNGSTTATISGATIQYASLTGTFNQYHTLPNITLAPGQTYLIQEAAGTGGTTGLNADYVAPVPSIYSGQVPTAAGLAMGGSGFKVVLASNATQVTSSTDANVLDFLGAGSTASQYEGTGPAPAPSTTNSVARTGGIDTNNNAADFKAGTPTPQNSVLAVSDTNLAKVNLVKNSNVNNSLTFGAKANVQILNANGQVVRTAAVSENSTLDVSSLTKGMYIVNAEVNGQKVSQKIIKN